MKGGCAEPWRGQNPPEVSLAGSSLLCEACVVFGWNRHRDNNLPDEVPTWILNLSNAGALGPVAFIVT